jgi:hypothetical protein
MEVLVRGTGRMPAILFAAFAAAAVSAQESSRSLGTGYRLRLIEPTEGATLSSTAVRVTTELTPRDGERAPARNATPTPPPRLDLFLDGAAVGTMKEDQSTVVLQGVAPGTHALLVTASDSSGAVVDRAGVHFTVLPPKPE